MIRIDIDFETIREKIYDVVDAGVNFAADLEEKFNAALDSGEKVSLDFETTQLWPYAKRS